MKLSTRTILSLLIASAVAALGIGFLFHTSHDAQVLGKYSRRYVMLPIGWYALIVPAAFFMTRFVLGTQYIVTSRRKIAVRPRAKIITLLVVTVVVGLGVDSIMRSLIARRTSTMLQDVFHPYLQNTPNPNSRKISLNDAGFRGRKIQTERRKRSFRVFMLGGSTMFCGSLRIPDTHCGLLEEKLKATYPNLRIEVQNAGGDWHTTQHSVMKLLFQVQEYKPDLVIMYHGVNDLLRSLSPDAFAEGEYRADYSHYYAAAANLKHPDRTRELVFRMYTGCWFSDFRFDTVAVLGPEGRGINGMHAMFFPKSKEVEVTEWKSLASFERNTRDFVQIARSKDMRVLLATQPHFYKDDLTDEERQYIWFPASQTQNGTKPSIPSMKRGMDEFNAKTKLVAEELAVDLVDLDAVVPKTLDYFFDDVHYTKPGNEIIAQAFHDHIVERGLVPEMAARAGR